MPRRRRNLSIQGAHLQRTISAPPLASVQIGRPMRDCLFEFTSIFDGDAFADSPPPAHKRPGSGGMCNIHASSASDVSIRRPSPSTLWPLACCQVLE